jgi:hypothetical protein
MARHDFTVLLWDTVHPSSEKSCTAAEELSEDKPHGGFFHNRSVDAWRGAVSVFFCAGILC